MPLTRDFKTFVKARIESDPGFAQALFQEAMQTLIDGDVATAKSVLRDYINATVGFEGRQFLRRHRRAAGEDRRARRGLRRPTCWCDLTRSNAPPESGTLPCRRIGANLSRCPHPEERRVATRLEGCSRSRQAALQCVLRDARVPRAPQHEGVVRRRNHWGLFPARL
jgi:hypothetical protein